MKHNKTKTSYNLVEKYDENFIFIEKVINSCVNKIQLGLALSWGIAYLERASNYEYDRRCSSEYWVVKSYFDTKMDIIIFKAQEALKNLC